MRIFHTGFHKLCPLFNFLSQWQRPGELWVEHLNFGRLRCVTLMTRLHSRRSGSGEAAWRMACSDVSKSYGVFRAAKLYFALIMGLWVMEQKKFALSREFASELNRATPARLAPPLSYLKKIYYNVDKKVWWNNYLVILENCSYGINTSKTFEIALKL